MTILITGATGLVGTKLCNYLINQGHTIHYLTTRSSAIEKKNLYKGFLWNVDQMTIDQSCIIGVDTVIHLAGASVFQRWTSQVKQQITNSRLDSTKLLFNLLKNNPNQVKHIISTSAIGIYPDNQQSHAYQEHEVPPYAQGFLGDLCVQWEQQAQTFKQLNITVAIVRIGIVLSSAGGALEQMSRPVKWWLGSAFGDGMMWQSWIAIDDLVRIFEHITKHQLNGIYNAVAPNPVSNKELIKAIGKTLNKPIWLPNVPEFIMRLILGEMSSIVLSSQYVSSQTIEQKGFEFIYPKLTMALNDYL